MNDTDPVRGYVMCVPWELRKVPSVKRKCAMCQCDIALYAKNVIAVEGFVLLCMADVLEYFPVDTPVGGLVSGKLYESMRDAFLAADVEQRRN